MEIHNPRVFNDLGFVAHSARVSGVGKIPCECGGREDCGSCRGEATREPSDREIFDMVLENDYSSALEHIVFTFEIHGLSKGNAAELLEHRMASHTGRSTRYKTEEGFGYVIPPAVKEVLSTRGISEKEFRAMVERGEFDLDLPQEEKGILESYFSAMRCAMETYTKLLESGVPRESARYALPFAVHTAYTYTMNLRSMINFMGLRLCVRASPEMRHLASKLYLAVREVFPEVDKIWCRGYNMAACPENEVRDSPQGRECPFKSANSEVFIPTKKQVRAGIELNRFSGEKFSRVKEKLLDKWSNL